MKVTFIDHSGYLVELAEVQLLFDYFQGALDGLHPEKPLVIFSSHAHHDHFNPEVFALAAEKVSAPITAVLSDDISESLVPEEWRSCCQYIGPHESKEFDLPGAEPVAETAAGVREFSVSTLISTDQGVAFIIDIEGRKIYFGGDLNNWYWKGRDTAETDCRIYREELHRIADKRFDLAFVPLDPRLEEYYHLGVTDFLRICNTRYLFPMHMWADFSVVPMVKSRPEVREAGKAGTQVMDVIRRRQQWDVE